MKFAEIEKKFSEKVAEYMNKGMVMNLYTMRGSQTGCEGQVDFKYGDKVLRVALLTSRENIGKICDRIPVYAMTYSIVVGTGNGNALGTIWNSDLDVIEREDFYRIDSDDWYVDSLEEYLAGVELGFNRVFARRDKPYRREMANQEAAKLVVLKHARRQAGSKRAKIEDIGKVNIFTFEDEKCYEYTYKGKRMTINV